MPSSAGCTPVHVLDQLRLAIVDAGPADAVDAGVWNLAAPPRKISGSCSVKEIGLARVTSVDTKPEHEPPAA